MIAAPLGQEVLFAIDYHSRDVLVHEDENGCQDSEQWGQDDVNVPRVVPMVVQSNEPPSPIPSRFER